MGLARFLQKLQQVSVDSIRFSCGDAMSAARIVDLLCPADQFGRLLRRDRHRNNLVVLAVKQQGRDIELLEILREVGFLVELDLAPKILATMVKSIHTTLGTDMSSALSVPLEGIAEPRPRELETGGNLY